MIKRISLKTDDLVVVTHPASLSDEQKQVLALKIQDGFKENIRVLVLDDGMTLSVIHAKPC